MIRRLSGFERQGLCPSFAWSVETVVQSPAFVFERLSIWHGEGV